MAAASRYRKCVLSPFVWFVADVVQFWKIPETIGRAVAPLSALNSVCYLRLVLVSVCL